MNRIQNIFTPFRAAKQSARMVFAIALVLTLPITIFLVGTPQDTRQSAQTATTTWTYASGYSNTQGQNNISYLGYTTQRSLLGHEGYVNLVNDGTKWVLPTGVSNDSNFSISALTISPALDVHDVVRWTAPTAGTIQVNGTFQRNSTTAAADAALPYTTYFVKADGQTQWTHDSSDTTAYNFNLPSITVNAGSTIEFWVNANYDSTGDTSSLAFTIQYNTMASPTIAQQPTQPASPTTVACNNSCGTGTVCVNDQCVIPSPTPPPAPNCNSSAGRPDLCQCLNPQGRSLNQCANVCTTDINGRGSTGVCCPSNMQYCSTLGACVSGRAECPAAGSTVAISVNTPGIGTNVGDNQSPKNMIIAVTVQVYGSDGTKVGTPTTGKLVFNGKSFTGNVPITTLTDGTPFYITVHTQNTLTKRTSGILTYKSNSSIPAGILRLTIGDILQDNVLNVQDYNILVTCYGQTAAGSCQNADLNDDGIVDGQDLNILYFSFANISGEESNGPTLCTTDIDCDTGYTCQVQGSQKVCLPPPAATATTVPTANPSITCEQVPACPSPPQGCSYQGATSCTCGTLACADTTPMHCGGNIPSPAQCPSGFYCRLGSVPDTGGECQPLEGANASCTSDEECQPGLRCYDNCGTVPAGGTCTNKICAASPPLVQ